MWSLSELTQAVVIVAHVHALSIFLAGCKLYSVDAIVALFEPSSCSEQPTDKPSLPDSSSSNLFNNLVSVISNILYLRSVDMWIIFLKIRVFLYNNDNNNNDNEAA